MRLSSVLVTVLVTLGFCNAQSLSKSNVSAIDFSKIPGCGLVCLVQNAPRAGCEFSDVNCMCTSQKMIDLTTRCSLSNCTIEEGFSFVRQQAEICGYGNESKNERVRVVILTFAIITKVIVPLRIILRLLSQRSLWWDDWLILAAFCTDTTAFYSVLQLVNNGLGEHVWNVTPAQLDVLLLWTYVVLCMYVVSNGLIKLSILAFYLRIFTVRDRFRMLCWINIVFCGATSFTFVFVTLFQCVPIRNSFELLPKDGFCINYNAATWAHAALTVFQDTLVVVLPVTEVCALQMSMRKKIGVILIFVLGGFVVVASMIRMATLKTFGRTSDPTWTNVGTTVWSAIELGVGLACASIPGIYTGLRQVWPAFRAFTRRHISQNNSGDSSSKPTKESKNSSSSDNSVKHNPNLKHTPTQRARYRRASLDLLPLTNMSADEEHDLERLNSVSKDQINSNGSSSGGGGWNNQYGSDESSSPVEANTFSPTGADLNKPFPPLPQDMVDDDERKMKHGRIEAVTTVTITKGLRSPSYDGWFERHNRAF